MPMPPSVPSLPRTRPWLLPSISRFSIPSASLAMRIARPRHCGSRKRGQRSSGSKTWPSPSTTMRLDMADPLHCLSRLAGRQDGGPGWRRPAMGARRDRLTGQLVLAAERVEIVAQRREAADHPLAAPQLDDIAAEETGGMVARLLIGCRLERQETADRSRPAIDKMELIRLPRSARLPSAR